MLHPSPRERGENSQFEIVAAGGTNGQAEKGDREYHIIAVHSGLYVTKKGTSTTCGMKPTY
jgi:hypothetical protein